MVVSCRERPAATQQQHIALQSTFHHTKGNTNINLCLTLVERDRAVRLLMTFARNLTVHTRYWRIQTPKAVQQLFWSFDLIFCLLVRSSISKSLEGQIGMYMVHAVRMRELYRRRCEYGVAQVNR